MAILESRSNYVIVLHVLLSMNPCVETEVSSIWLVVRVLETRIIRRGWEGMWLLWEKERKKQGGDLRKEYIRIYSHVLACKPSLIRVNCWNLVSLAFAKISYFFYDPNHLLCFEILYFSKLYSTWFCIFPVPMFCIPTFQTDP